MRNQQTKGKGVMDKPQAVRGVLIENNAVAAGDFQMTIRLPGSFPSPIPGQFVMIRGAEQQEPLLARPLSVYGFRQQGEERDIDLLYRVVGKGTSLLSGMEPGTRMVVLGPLGNGFTPPGNTKNVILVAGGVGVAPLTFLLRSGWLDQTGIAASDCICYLGARTGEQLTGLEGLQRVAVNVCTDDGSKAFHGTVTDLLRRDIEQYNPHETMIYACGPSAMIRSLGRLLDDRAIPCQVSLEERMACGLGACLGCAVAVHGKSGRKEYRRVCKDGPVFDLREIVFALTPGRDEGGKNG